MNPDVLAAIPHRPPFLYVDEIVERTDGALVAVKTVSPDEPFFQGHYPGFPIMPGVLICEAVIQAGAILLAHRARKTTGAAASAAAGAMAVAADSAAPQARPKVPVLARISSARFKRMVRPGETLTLRAELTDEVSGVFFMKGRASVGDQTVATLEFACALSDPPETRNP